MSDLQFQSLRSRKAVHDVFQCQGSQSKIFSLAISAVKSGADIARSQNIRNLKITSNSAFFPEMVIYSVNLNQAFIQAYSKAETFTELGTRKIADLIVTCIKHNYISGVAVIICVLF